ncbi:MAG: hypothetical protein Q8N85_01730 [Candidatus Omnitrophota bacterium]|nr:hypothetical protein [Candidatus Omnitrophota bacterium]
MMNYAKLRVINKPYFSYQEISRALGIGLASARVASSRLVKAGLLLRAKRNIYISREKWDGLAQEDKFGLANLIQVPSYISLMTALDYYAVTTQVQRGFIESVGVYRTKEVTLDKDTFRYTKISKRLYFGFNRQKGFFIASPEKAFLDAAYLASLKRYSFDLSSIDFSKLSPPKLKDIAMRFPKATQTYLEKYGYLKKARDI